MWVAAATYCSLLAPKNLLATLIGVLGMAHFSLGRGSGSFIGGELPWEILLLLSVRGGVNCLGDKTIFCIINNFILLELPEFDSP